MKRSTAREYIDITSGSLAIALAIYFFLIPGDIIMGSITGLAMVLVHFIPVTVSVMTFMLNVFCLIVGFLFVGREFGAKTVYASLIMPCFLGVLERIFPGNKSLTGDLILDTLCCILIIGMGQALLFNANASSGGLDIIAKIMNKYLHIEVGKGCAVIGILTVMSSMLVYDTKMLVLGILGTYFNGVIVDEYIGGFSRRKRVCILSEQTDELRRYILHDLNRGVTMYPAKGGYEQKDKEEIVTILENNEYAQLINYVRKIDEHAFITVSTVNEVVGVWSSGRRKREYR